MAPATLLGMANHSGNSHSDVLIVGAGIIGLTHAQVALACGLSVRVIERAASAVGASVRNFGHLCFSAQSDELQPLATASREGWLQTVHDLDLWHQARGTVAAARTESEMTLLKNLESRRAGIELLDQRAMIQELDGLGGGLRGGAVLTADLRVNPRDTAAKLAESLQQRGVDICYRTSATDVRVNSTGVQVQTSRGTMSADRVFVCVGHDVDHLFGHIADQYQVSRCRLNMVRAELPNKHRIRAAILTTTSMARYGAFTETAGIDDVRHELDRRSPHLKDIVANVMCTQLPDGSLLIGDSHHYGDDAPPFQDEHHTLWILDELRDVLGVTSLAVVERWQGVYASSNLQTVLRTEVMPGVQLISVTSGIGMTLSHGIARESFA